MYIQKIEIKNFRNFADFKMSFKDGLNVIVGSNNSGKTNLLKAIELLTKPDTLTIHDFNKNMILSNYKTLYKKEAPEIEIIYQIKHEISEENTEDESILKLIPFLGLDKIRDEIKKQSRSNHYNILADIKIKYVIDPKKLDNYTRNVDGISTFQEYIDALELSLSNYSWIVTNANDDSTVDKSKTTDIFKIDFIEADRDTKAVLKETRKTIKDFIDDEQNLASLQSLKKSISSDIKTKIEPALSKISNVVEQEKNEIGLAKGNVSIAQDLQLEPSIIDSYVIDVKDTKSDYIIPLSHNGIGYNNLINIYMLIKLVEIKPGKDFRILCLEEPEAHLHPAMQYKLFSYLKKIEDEDKLNQQIFVTTHSSNITAVAGMDNLYMLDYQRENSKADVMSRGLKDQFIDIINPHKGENSKKHIMKFLDVTRSDMLFANKVILVEGIAEKLLLPTFMELSGCSYEDEHISIVEIGGKHFEHFLEIYANNPIEKKVLCITDKDYPSIEDELKQIAEYQKFIPDHVKRIKESYKKCENIEVIYQTNIGTTFEDEIFLENFNKNDCLIGCKLLRIALGESLHLFIDSNCLQFSNWKENKNDIDGRSKSKIFKIMEIFENAIKNYPKDIENYETLFFAKLFLSYAISKKGDVALQILTDDLLTNSLIVPQYIREGLNWLLK